MDLQSKPGPSSCTQMTNRPRFRRTTHRISPPPSALEPWIAALVTASRIRSSQQKQLFGLQNSQQLLRTVAATRDADSNLAGTLRRISVVVLTRAPRRPVIEGHQRPLWTRSRSAGQPHLPVPTKAASGSADTLPQGIRSPSAALRVRSR